MAGDRFLSRWSRRKAQTRRGAVSSEAKGTKAAVGSTAPLAVEQETLPPVVEHVHEAELPQAAPEHEELSDSEIEEISDRLGLPPVESLGPGSDFSVFMKEGVPESLRRLAIRRLWRSNPAYQTVDPLIDYGEDYTDAATVVENLKTAYQVGKGYLKPEEEVELDDQDSGFETGEGSVSSRDDLGDDSPSQETDKGNAEPENSKPASTPEQSAPEQVAPEQVAPEQMTFEKGGLCSPSQTVKDERQTEVSAMADK